MTAIASFHPQQMIDTAAAITAAYVLAVPLGWERKTEGKAHVGFRTLPLVSVGTCAYLLLSRFLFEREVFDADGTARTLRAMMTGIGFIGGGAILKHAASVKGVKGVTTATSVWTTGAIAASVAHGYYVIAVALSLTSVLFVQISGSLARRARAVRDPDNDEFTSTSRS
jgi:putative Mg2+ transporter-C (MgtC) family protein